jgi:hypothetical protein
MLLPQRQLLYLPSLTLVEDLVHIVVRPVAEGLEGEELSPVLYVAELLQGTPSDEVVVLEDEVLGTVALLG